MTAAEIVAELGLQPHPEGGHYRQTWIAASDAGGRPIGTCIYFLLAEGERSHWHKVDATEIWHFHAGADLVLSLSETEAGPASAQILTADLTRGAPQLIVPAQHWQCAETTGAYTLVSCTVTPGFQFSGFTLAEPDFDIPRAQ
ncbi:MAG: cupin domain-containing protein [Pseudomonadota bacterium]